MTLRQAMAALEKDGLARGKGTFVSERPVDISIGNLSSFAQHMRSAAVRLETDVLSIEVVSAADASVAAAAFETITELAYMTRRRRVNTGGLVARSDPGRFDVR